MDNSNLRQEQMDSLAEAIQTIEEACSLLGAGKVNEADQILHNARNKVNAVLSGDRRDIESSPR